MITFHDVEQGTPEWHELRNGKITASNAGVLLTKGRNDAINVKSNFTGNWYTQRGHTLEPEAIELYERINDVVVKRVGFITNDKYPDCGYSPDGIETNICLIEVKAFNERRHMDAFVNTPFEVIAQIQFGLMITEMPFGVLVLYNPDIADVSLNLLMKTIPRDDAIIKNMERKLWEK